MSTEETRMEPANKSEPQAAGTEMQPTPEMGTGSNTIAKTSDPALSDELREFGKQIEGIFQTFRNSARGKELEAQLTLAWRDVEKGVNEAIAKAQASDIKGTVQGTAHYASEEVQSGLARGLKNLNQWMAQKRAEAEQRIKEREAAASAAAMRGTADDEVADRFSGSEQPVFSVPMNMPKPEEPGQTPAEAKGKKQDDIISDRFDEQVKL